MSSTSSTPVRPAAAAAGPKRDLPTTTRVFYDDDEENEHLLAKEAPKKEAWRNNIWVPLGAFGGAVALGVGIVLSRRKAGWGMSQTIMQARVAAQGACVAGLVGFGAYTAYTAKQRKNEERDD